LLRSMAPHSTAPSDPPRLASDDSTLPTLSNVASRADGKQLCCRPGTAVKLLWPEVNPAWLEKIWRFKPYQAFITFPKPALEEAPGRYHKKTSQQPYVGAEWAIMGRAPDRSAAPVRSMCRWDRPPWGSSARMCHSTTVKSPSSCTPQARAVVRHSGQRSVAVGCCPRVSHPPKDFTGAGGSWARSRESRLFVAEPGGGRCFSSGRLT
jgi:hypothetical protein